MLLRSSPERQEAELDYVRDMNLNTVRLEGKLEDEHFFELVRPLRHPGHGRLVLLRPLGALGATGTPEDDAIAAASLRDQIRRLRSHPSCSTG